MKKELEHINNDLQSFFGLLSEKKAQKQKAINILSKYCLRSASQTSNI